MATVISAPLQSLLERPETETVAADDQACELVTKQSQPANCAPGRCLHIDAQSTADYA